MAGLEENGARDRAIQGSGYGCGRAVYPENCAGVNRCEPLSSRWPPQAKRRERRQRWRCRSCGVVAFSLARSPRVPQISRPRRHWRVVACVLSSRTRECANELLRTRACSSGSERPRCGCFPALVASLARTQRPLRQRGNARFVYGACALRHRALCLAPRRASPPPRSQRSILQRYGGGCERESERERAVEVGEEQSSRERVCVADAQDRYAARGRAWRRAVLLYPYREPVWGVLGVF